MVTNIHGKKPGLIRDLIPIPLRSSEAETAVTEPLRFILNMSECTSLSVFSEDKHGEQKQLNSKSTL
jgi:hypothetical protein